MVVVIELEIQQKGNFARHCRRSPVSLLALVGARHTTHSKRKYCVTED